MSPPVFCVVVAGNPRPSFVWPPRLGVTHGSRCCTSTWATNAPTNRQRNLIAHFSGTSRRNSIRIVRARRGLSFRHRQTKIGGFRRKPFVELACNFLFGPCHIVGKSTKIGTADDSRHFSLIIYIPFFLEPLCLDNLNVNLNLTFWPHWLPLYKIKLKFFLFFFSEVFLLVFGFKHLT